MEFGLGSWSVLADNNRMVLLVWLERHVSFWFQAFLFQFIDFALEDNFRVKGRVNTTGLLD